MSYADASAGSVLDRGFSHVAGSLRKGLEGKLGRAEQTGVLAQLGGYDAHQLARCVERIAVELTADGVDHEWEEAPELGRRGRCARG